MLMIIGGHQSFAMYMDQRELSLSL
jgi:hypothetical protein